MIYQNDILPTLTTKRIILSNPQGLSSTYQRGRNRRRGGLSRRRAMNREENQTLEQRESKIKVEFLISSKEDSPEYSWFTDQEMSPFINAHFIVLDDTTADYLPRLVNLETRREALLELLSLAPHTYVTLSQILRREFHAVTPSREMSLYYMHDIYHEVEIDVPNYSKTVNNNIHLVSFFHLDVENYMEHNNIDSIPEEVDDLGTIGGSLVYDLLLKKEQNRLIIPAFRNIYFVETSRNIETSSGTVNRTVVDAYSGPVHYHGPDNEGPNGYIGWMAGPAGHGEMGPPLRERQVRNYKVLSDSYFSENAESIFSLNCDTQYSDTISENLAAAHLDPFSEPESLNDLQINLESILNKSTFPEETANKTIVDYGSRDTAHINVVYDPNNPNGVPLQQSNYGCVVGVDFFQIVRNNSDFGNIIKFHHDKGNTDIINDVLYRSIITKLSVLRHRVEEYPTMFSDQCTLRYKRFDPNEPDKLLVHAEDKESISFVYPIPSAFLKGRLIATDTPNASIEEVDLLNVSMLPDGGVVYTETPDFLRSFVIRDRDLFHNYSAGKYTYTLQIDINDGMKTLMSDLVEYAYLAREAFSRYYHIATIPVSRDSNGAYISGNFDVKLNQFHESFRELDFSQQVQYGVSAFARLVLLLTGDPLPESDLESLRLSLIPSGTTITTLETFNRVLESLEISLLRLLFSHAKYHDPYKRQVLRKKVKTNVKKSNSFVTNTISVKAKTGIIVDAFSETTLLADFSIREIHDANDSVPNIARLFEENQERANAAAAASIRLPRRFITVSPAVFQADGHLPIPSEFPELGQSNQSDPGSQSNRPSIIDMFSMPTPSDLSNPVSTVTQLGQLAADSSRSSLRAESDRRARESEAQRSSPMSTYGVIERSIEPTMVAQSQTARARNFLTTPVGESSGRTQYSTVKTDQYKPYLKNGKSKKLSKGGIKEVSNIKDYASKNSAGRAAVDMKIDTVRILDSQDTGIIQKGHVFFPNNLMHFGGGIQFGPSDSFQGFDPNVSLFDPNNQITDNRPNISSALRKAICDAAYKGDDPQSLLDAIENIFEDIVITRQELGSIFDRVATLVGNTSRVANNFASVSFEDKYLGNVDIREAEYTLKQNSYEKEKAKLSILGPKQEPREVNITTLASGPRMSTRINKKFVFAKFNTMKKDDNVISVNNGYLLEV